MRHLQSTICNVMVKMKALFILGAFPLFSLSLAFPVTEKKRQDEVLEGDSSDEIKGTLGVVGRKRRSTQLQNVLKKYNPAHLQRIWKYLKTYGYISDEIQSFEDKQLVVGMWKFAVWNGARIGKKLFIRNGLAVFERRLRSISTKPRCGNPDLREGKFGQKIRASHTLAKRYFAQTPWGKNNLTYKIESFDNDLTSEVQRQEIAKAFELWTDASELSVSEVQGSQNADINIQFVAGAHSDSQPFDGPGLVVAHAFYPEDGRIHFDYDEVFTTGGEANKVNLLSVAAHEIGHALGLGHSAQSDAVMNAQYQPYSPNFALSQDDIDGIEYLYPSSNSGCVDEPWCEDILQNECSYFEEYCKEKCGAC